MTELKKILKKAFEAGYDTSTMYNCGSCEGAFDNFEDWFESTKPFFNVNYQIKN